MRHPAIVVGIDGSEQSRTAVRWAASEARLHDIPLKILTAYTWNGPPEAFGGVGELPDVITQQFDQLAAGAVAEARAWEPGIEVSGAAVTGDPASVLLDAGRTAALLVVGNRGRGGFASLLLGSVSQQVATHATGPVVVVRGQRETPSGPVMVGVDGSASAQRALALGFDEAQRRGRGLLAVRSYPVPMPPYGMDMPPLPYDQDAASRDAARDLDATLTPWRDKYPAVRVQTLIEPGSPARNLVDASREATLLIVGSRGHGALVGSLLGSVGQQLLHHADCPVMIVHPEQP
ncbi:universal stress protein [Actinoplanes sp. ATCC 53533]|uniref:universal stress protein n=1 Tax=Actinoplanes sp. ATCC 53533 TaxID=1288362 RepID=UPI000F7A26CA|nr:universal stress protein [Actinoplanes sp. ATCC 53533]RSM73789.1 universal stress protein [Actinoplanes sp. ATCC 53533]